MLWLSIQPRSLEQWACRWLVSRFVDPSVTWQISEAKERAVPGPQLPIESGRVLGPATKLGALISQSGLKDHRFLKRFTRELRKASRARKNNELPGWAPELLAYRQDPRNVNEAQLMRAFDALYAFVGGNQPTNLAPETAGFCERALQRMPVALMLADRDGVIRYANPRCARELNLRQEEMHGVPFRQLPLRFVDAAGVEFNDQARVCATLLSRTRPVEGLIVAIVGPGGVHINYCMLSAEVHRVAADSFELLVTLVDVSRQLLIEQALRASESRIAALLEAMPHGVVEIGLDGRIDYASAALARICGCATQELQGREITSLLENTPAYGRIKTELADWLLSRTESVRCWGRVIAAGGNGPDVQFDGQARRNHQGVIVGFVAVLTDVSDRRRLEQQVQEEMSDMFGLKRKLLHNIA